MKQSILKEYNPKYCGIKLYDYIKQFKLYGHRIFIENKNGKLIEHIYDVALRHRKGVESVDIREIARITETKAKLKDCYYLDYGCARGWHTIWNEKGSYYHSNKLDTKWWEIDLKFVTNLTGTNIQTPKEIIEMDKSLKYSAYDGKYDFMQFYRLYKKYPIAEMVMKLKLYQFLNEKALKELTNNKAFRSYVYSHREEIGNLSYVWTKNAFKRNVKVNDYACSLNDRIQCGKIAKEALREQYEFVKKYASQERIAKYIKDNNINRGSYADYIQAVRWLQLDLSDTKVLFPKNFNEVHDTYTKQYSDYKAEQEAIKNQNISSVMEIVANEFKFVEMDLKGFVFKVARNKLDLINEGNALKHCVGRMDYDKRQADRKSIICFVRKESLPETPFITIELNCSDLRVLQCYAEHDSRPEQEIMDIVDLWRKKIVRNGGIEE